MPINHARKSAARAYAAQHGVSYVEALGAVTQRPADLVWDGTRQHAFAITTQAGQRGYRVETEFATDPTSGHSDIASLLVHDADGLRRVLPGGIVLTAAHVISASFKVAEQFAPASVGDRIRFTPQPGRTWWRIHARDDRYLIAAQQAPFQPKGTLWYTVVDLSGWTHTYNGVRPGVVRSSLNTLGGSHSLNPIEKACAEILAGLQSGRWELSRRRVAPVDGIEIAPRR